MGEYELTSLIGNITIKEGKPEMEIRMIIGVGIK